jgi:hypothetical protein
MVLAVIDPLPSETSRPGNEDRGTESRHACGEADACRKRQTSRSTSHSLTATHERILPRSGAPMRTPSGRYGAGVAFVMSGHPRVWSPRCG